MDMTLINLRLSHAEAAARAQCLGEILKELNTEPSPQIPLPLAVKPNATVDAPAAVQAAEVAASKPRGRPAKTETAAPAAPAATAQAPTADAAATKPITMDDCRTALAKLNDKFGIDVARSTLIEHGAKRMGELKPENFVAFHAACQQKMGPVINQATA